MEMMLHRPSCFMSIRGTIGKLEENITEAICCCLQTCIVVFLIHGVSLCTVVIWMGMPHQVRVNFKEDIGERIGMA